MLLDYYNLKEQPFGVTPDPRYLYMSTSHREALASLSYGIRSGRGFVSLIAKPGMGKTTTLFQLLSELEGSARTVFLFQTLCSPQELLHGVLHDLGVVRIGSTVVRMQQQLNRVLLEEARKGRKVVVVIDEAQNLEESGLELLRMLSNFETASEKMMQIVLAGQPQLREKLASPQLLQLRQRMSIFARLDPFNADETRLYVEHRLSVAGYKSQTPLFTPHAEALIVQHGEGNPRNINNICFNALSLGWVLKQRTITKEVISEVLRDLGLVPEDDNLREPSTGRAWVGWRAVRSSAVFQQAFALRKRLAVFSMLLLPLVWLSGPGRSVNTVAPAHLSAAGLTSQQPLASTSLADPANVTGASLKTETQPAVESDSNPAARRVSDQPRARRSRKSSLQSQPDSPQNQDISQLWRQVKKHSSNAEVDLARLYLEGSVVPQNCAQARVLLMDASRKGNTRATDLFKGSTDQCHWREPL